VSATAQLEPDSAALPDHPDEPLGPVPSTLPNGFKLHWLQMLTRRAPAIGEMLEHRGGTEIGPLVWFGEIDRLLRATAPQPMETVTLAASFAALQQSEDWAAFLNAMVIEAGTASEMRRKEGRPRSMWGTTPIVSIRAGVAADRRLGIEAESVVLTTYYVTSDFDINLTEHVAAVRADGAELENGFYWAVLIWALLSFDNFFYFYDRGILPAAVFTGRLQMGIDPEELSLLRRCGKQVYVLPYGADYRTRDKTIAYSSFNFCMDCPEIGKFCFCNDELWPAVFDTTVAHATAVLSSGLALEQLPGSRRLEHIVVDTDALDPCYPHPAPGDKIKLLHVPNHPHFKGTRYLQQAIEALPAGCPIQFTLASGVSNAQVLALMREADVVIDQLIGGNFGLTALEAMALGKPVVVYIAKWAIVLAPEECPLINANPDTIGAVLTELVANPAKLREIGRRSRAYVEKHYSIGALAERLRALYQDTPADPTAIERDRLHATSEVLRREVELANAELEQNLRQLTQIQAELTVIYNSRLWRFTEPIRVINRLLPQVYARARRLCRAAARAACRRLGLVALNGMVPVARALTAIRWRVGCPRTLWGTTPILTLPLLAECDRRLGFASRSLVFTTYYITRDFDLNLERPIRFLSRHAPWLMPLFHHAVFVWCMLHYDVFHFFVDRGILPAAGRIGFDPDEAALLHRAGKRLYTYTYGADVRTRDATFALGTYNFCVDCPEPGRFCICDDATGAAMIANLKPHVTAMLAMGDMLTYVPNAIEAHFWPIDVTRLSPALTTYRGDRPLRVLHAPNHTHFKGTRHLQTAVAHLRSQGHAIELELVQGVPNTEAITRMRGADVIAEQFIGGFYGYTALEAMALGKPVISYVRDRRLLLAPEECPLLDADPDHLEAVLLDCLIGRYDLAALGRQGRAYVEKYHSIDAVAVRLGQLYLRTGSLPARFANQIEQRVARLQTKLHPTPILRHAAA
jgi:hypothetical protein